MTPGRGRQRRVSARGVAAQSAAPDVYEQMLAETAVSDQTVESPRPLKRRRVLQVIKSDGANGDTMEDPELSAAKVHLGHQNAEIPLQRTQTVEDSSESDTSDLEFEDVSLRDHIDTASEVDDQIEDLSISLQSDEKPKSPSVPKRRPASVAEKTQRLLVHKLYILCLLGHCMYVNGRCNNAKAHRALRAMLTERTISFLNPDTSKSQYQRNSTFLDGLNQAVDTFVGQFRIIGSGLSKPEWARYGEEPSVRIPATPSDRYDFLKAAENLEGSQDTGNQLFCALLRSVGVAARVVCSLQTLPFANVPKSTTPQKPTKTKFLAIASDRISSMPAGDFDPSIPENTKAGKVPPARRRIGQPAFATVIPQTALPKNRTRPIRKLSYPVFWVEAFNTAHQKWISVDPIVTNSINKPSKLEPPVAYSLNQLSYAIAFEEDGVARDVTKRYAKAFNAKTRRQRVEASGETGSAWWQRTMRVFRRLDGRLDRDQVEDAEMAQKEAREGLPSNVLDFKDHPYYALERHMKRNEVIYRKREVGKINAGTALKPRMEAIYRRQDVLICKSADKWYRMGREVKPGEQPVKHVAARVRRNRSPDLDHDGDDGHANTTGLYASSQTQLYIPPPVKHGRIPKNIYGNLDVYVPSMIPAGAVHVPHSMAQRAAKLISVDYADAVTGFQFKGRHGTAVLEGVVVDEQNADAIRAVIEGFEHEALEHQSRARSLEALKSWKRFISGLRIAERVRGYGDGSVADVEDDENENEGESGLRQSMPPEPDEQVLSTAGKYSIADLTRSAKKAKKPMRKVSGGNSDEDQDALWDANNCSASVGMDHTQDYAQDVEMEGGFLAEQESYGESGGFLPEPPMYTSGGGFIRESHRINPGGTSLQEAQQLREDMEYGHTPERPERSDTHTDERTGGVIHDDHFGEGLDLNSAERNEDSGHSQGLRATSHDAHGVPDAHMQDATNDTAGSFGSKLQPGGPHEAAAIHLVEAPSSNPFTLQEIDRDVRVSEARTNAEADTKESDEGSVMSHDPDDDDAEPEWLESD